MPETISCPGCSASFVVAEEILGKRVRCRKCQQPFTASLPSDDPLANVLEQMAAVEKRAPTVAPAEPPPSEQLHSDQPPLWLVLLMANGHHLVFLLLFIPALATFGFGFTAQDEVVRRGCIMTGGLLAIVIGWAKVEVELTTERIFRIIPCALIGALFLYYNHYLAIKS